MTVPFKVTVLFADDVLSDEALAAADEQALKAEAMRLLLAWGSAHGVTDLTGEARSIWMPAGADHEFILLVQQG